MLRLRVAGSLQIHCTHLNSTGMQAGTPEEDTAQVKACTCSRPGNTREDPMAKDSGVQDQWICPTLRNGLTAKNNILVIAMVLETSTLAMFKTHKYSFGGKYYL